MKEFSNHKIVLFVDVDGFERLDLQHDWTVAYSATRCDLFRIEDVQVRVLLVDRRKILGAQQHRRVVIDRGAIGSVKTRLEAGHGEQRVIFGQVVLELGDRSFDRLRAEQRIG